MDWANMHHVRLYPRTDNKWNLLGWEGRFTYYTLIQYVSDKGELGPIDEHNEPEWTLSLISGEPAEIMKIGLRRLINKGFITFESELLTIVDFEESQRAKRSRAQRMRDLRLRKKGDELYEKMVAAHKAVADAVKDGSLIRENCVICGRIDTDGHHDDYDQPLVVRWLCKKHHRKEHSK